MADSELLRWLAGAQKNPWLASVGSGTLLLAAAGLLKDKKAAAAEEHLEQLRELGALPEVKELLEDDAIFTAADSSHALKLAFSLCAQLAGLGAAEQVRQQLGGEMQAGIPTEFTTDESLSSSEGLRYARVARITRETDIELELDLDGSGQHEIDTGLPFLDHMLAQVSAHGLFDLNLKAVGDLQIDPHHTMEDVSLALGEAFRLALGERGGIVRMASVSCPMDESRASVTVDFSGRPYAVIQAAWHAPHVGGLPVTLIKHFLESFASQARCNLHAQVHYGEDDHHQAEALFKALGRALDAATQIDERRGGEIPSTKGVLF